MRFLKLNYILLEDVNKKSFSTNKKASLCGSLFVEKMCTMKMPPAGSSSPQLLAPEAEPIFPNTKSSRVSNCLQRIFFH